MPINRYLYISLYFHYGVSSGAAESGPRLNQTVQGSSYALAQTLQDRCQIDSRTDLESSRCSAPEGGRFTGVAVELDAGNRIFTTLPVVPVPERTDRE